MKKKENKSIGQKSLSKVKRSKATAVNENHKPHFTKRSTFANEIGNAIENLNKVNR